jgi:hypothetical protein
LEGRPELCFRRFDDVGVFTADLEVFRLRQLPQLPFLAGDAYVVSIL